MNLFERNVDVFNEYNLTRIDTKRRRGVVRRLEEDDGSIFKFGKEEYCMFSIVQVEYPDEKDTSIKKTYICDISVKLPNINSTMLISVFSDELYFNMSWFHLNDDVDMIGNLMVCVIENLIQISDIKVIGMDNIKSECLKQWCVDNGFVMKTESMNRPADDYSVDMIIRRD